MPCKRLVKRLLAALPGPIDRGLVALLARLGLVPLAYQSFVAWGRPLTVEGGPFCGMEYLPSAAGSALYPKIFGTYELELQTWIETICATPHDLMINIGAAEGYYAIGLARRMPGLAIHCYDTDRRARGLLQSLARKNQVEHRIHIHGSCAPEDLETVIAGAHNPLIICDCEGCENELLVPDEAPQLRRATVLVELHDCFIAGTGRRIRERFQASHDIEVISAAPRRPEQLLARPAMAHEQAMAVMNEGRDPDQQWFFMSPREGRGP